MLNDIQAAIAAFKPGYVNMFTWQQNGDVIKAFPRRNMTEMGFNTVRMVFRKFGGKFVSHNRQAYFELIMEESGSQPSTFSPDGKGKASIKLPASGTALSHFEDQVRKLTSAGQALTNCHDCAYEWGDACAKPHVHLPANKPQCSNCSRNPKPKTAPFQDNFQTIAEAIEHVIAGQY